jgi:signal transduction histidine kinase
VSHRADILTRVHQKIRLRSSAPAIESDLPGVSRFLGQLAEMLEREQGTSERTSDIEMGQTATHHGGDSRRRGVTVAQLVHDYGDVCQAVTGLALELDVPISNDEFRTLNRCLDDAIAQAVTEFTRPPEAGPRQLGVFAHELKNLLSTSLLAFEALKDGTIGVGGSTGALLGRSLMRLRDLVNRSLTEVRLEAGVSRREHVVLADLIAEVEAAGMIHAAVARRTLTVSSVDPAVVIDVDRQLISAVLDNLLTNAFKFTRPGGHIVLRTDTAPPPRSGLDRGGRRVRRSSARASRGSFRGLRAARQRSQRPGPRSCNRPGECAVQQRHDQRA